MNQFNPKKLLNSKWTAVSVKNKEKHFIVTTLDLDEENQIVHCIIQAVYSNNEYEINWIDLKDTQNWLQGWK